MVTWAEPLSLSLSIRRNPSTSLVSKTRPRTTLKVRNTPCFTQQQIKLASQVGKTQKRPTSPDSFSPFVHLVIRLIPTANKQVDKSQSALVQASGPSTGGAVASGWELKWRRRRLHLPFCSLPRGAALCCSADYSDKFLPRSRTEALHSRHTCSASHSQPPTAVERAAVGAKSLSSPVSPPPSDFLMHKDACAVCTCRPLCAAALEKVSF